MRRWVARARVRASGLTLAEIVLAMGILAFIALTVVGVFLALLQSSAKNREQAMAELLTESLLEKAAAVGPPDWGVRGQIGIQKKAEDEWEFPSDGPTFFYQLDPVKVDTRPDSAAGETWKITATVGWWLAEDAPRIETSRVGFGNQYVKGVRTVYWRQGDGK